MHAHVDKFDRHFDYYFSIEYLLLLMNLNSFERTIKYDI